MNQRQDQLLVSTLARGESIVRAARMSGVSERTVHRRLNEPEFQAQIKSTRSMMVDSASSGIAGHERGFGVTAGVAGSTDF
jgi:hypothetical protein